MTTSFDELYLPGSDLGASFEYENTFSTINDMAQSLPHTVSPQELMMPAPGSSTFSYMDTPESSLMDSPAMASSAFNTTPLQDGELDANLNFEELHAMGPLFPRGDDYDQFGQAAFKNVMPTYSPKVSYSTATSSPMVKDNSSPGSAFSPMVRQKSSPGRHPVLGAGHGRKASLSTGVSKPSRPRGNLVPIEITSEDDRDTAKRKKNTAAARKSRERKNDASERKDAEIQRLRAIIANLGGNTEDDNSFL